MAAKKTSAAKKAPAKKAGAKKGGTINCGNWKAVLNTMPPGTPTLTVTGVCTTPTPGYKIKLVPAVPQPIIPTTLVLQKVVTPPTGIQPQVITKVTVTYSKKTKTRYKTVEIRPDGTIIKVKIVT
jgi:hypothetical protein